MRKPLTTLEVRDYQAIKSASIELGKLTVVTGPTGSGKSALVRALKLVAFNARGNSFVRRGATQTKVAVGSREEGWAASIARGKARTNDSYALSFMPQSGDAPHLEEFTKLGGGVPDEISAAIQLSDINFAGQFDRPFLLDASGGDVARTLGELTNVTLVFNAAREANRRRLALAGSLRDVESSHKQLRDQLEEYKDLKSQLDAMAEAARHMDRATALSDRLVRLGLLIAQHANAAERVELLSRVAAASEPPDPTRLRELREQTVQLQALIGEIKVHREDIRKAKAQAAQADEDLGSAEKELKQALVAVGECPTCGATY